MQTKNYTNNELLDILIDAHFSRNEATAKALMSDSEIFERALPEISRVFNAVPFFFQFCSEEQLVRAMNYSDRVCRALFKARNERTVFKTLFDKVESGEITCKFDMTVEPTLRLSSPAVEALKKPVCITELIGKTIKEVHLNDENGVRMENPLIILSDGRQCRLIL